MAKVKKKTKPRRPGFTAFAAPLFFSFMGAASLYAQTATTGSASKTAVRKGETSIGARVGMVNVSQLDNSLISYGIFGDQALSSRFTAGATLDYWEMSTGGLSDTRIGINDLALGANGKFIFTNVQSDFKPFATAGASLHRISLSKAEKAEEGTVLSRYRERNNDVSTQLGLDVGAGAIYTAQPQMDVNGQVIYRRLTNVGVNFNQFALTAGLGYRL